MDEQKIVGREVIYSGRTFRLSKYSVEVSGRTFAEEVVEHPGAVAVIPIAEDGRILLVRQFRAPIDRQLLELPAGTLKSGEREEECARRELAEETGHSAQSITRILQFVLAPGYSSERLTLFLARGLVPVLGTRRDEDESIEVVSVSLDEALDMIRSEKIADAKTIIGIFHLALARQIRS